MNYFKSSSNLKYVLVAAVCTGTVLLIVKSHWMLDYDSLSAQKVHVPDWCQHESRIASEKLIELQHLESSNYYASLGKDAVKCAEFKRGFPSSRDEDTSTEEKQFPLAFVYAVYTDVDHFARLLRATYRPSNVYCIHIDSKALLSYVSAVEGIVGCLNQRNIHILPSNLRLDVRWGYMTSLDCYLNCMRALVKPKLFGSYAIHWKYLLNFSGRDFPLKTNAEMVAILKSLNGGSIVEGVKRAEMKNSTLFFKNKNYTIIKGSAYFAASRSFVEFALNSPTAHELHTQLTHYSQSKMWRRLEERPVPDELYFSTLWYNPQLYGKGDKCSAQRIIQGKKSKHTFPRLYTVWDEARCHSHIMIHERNVELLTLTCLSKASFVKIELVDQKTQPYDAVGFKLFYPNARNSGNDVTMRMKSEEIRKKSHSHNMIHEVCMFGIKDVRRMLHQPQLSVNKFRQKVEPAAFSCLELWLRERVTHEHLKGSPKFTPSNVPKDYQHYTCPP